MAMNYEESIKCLQEKNDRPQLIHQAHVCAIIDTPFLNDGSGRELWSLRDTANQYMRAIKGMNYSPWSLLPLLWKLNKVDQTTMFEWQKHNQGLKEVLDYLELLEFLDLRAWAAKNSVGESEYKRPVVTPGKKNCL